MSPFEKAWRLLKMTPEEMEAAGFGEAAAQMRAMQEQEEKVRTQASMQKPTMTPQALSYQQQLDAKRQQEEHAQRIRAMLKEGRRRADVDKETEAFYQKYNRYPRGLSKTVMRRLDRLRERGD